VHERFARLGVISTILRKKESRERYDFFYKNGVPKWRGTGYYYSRFRPGLGVCPLQLTLSVAPALTIVPLAQSVLIFLIVLTSGLQLLVQSMNYSRDLKRIEKVRGEAMSAAWGPKLVPAEGQRKVSEVELSVLPSLSTKFLRLELIWAHNTTRMGEQTANGLTWLSKATLFMLFVS
jgi:DnaJ homolog subfamily C member 1